MLRDHHKSLAEQRNQARPFSPHGGATSRRAGASRLKSANAIHFARSLGKILLQESCLAALPQYVH